MKKKNPYDTASLIIVLSMLFTIGFHIGNDEPASSTEEVYVEISLERFKGVPGEREICFVDGKYEAVIIGFSQGTITLLCKGTFEEAGFLMCGAKYIGKNQPMKIHTEHGYFEGRIMKIIRL